MLTVAATYGVLRSNRARDELSFETAASETRQLIASRINTYIELLRAGAALFGSSNEVTADEFASFVGRLRVRERYPGIQGVGFAVRVTREEVADPGRRLSKLVIEERRVWPPGLRDEYTSIIFLQPPDVRNRRAMGYDMFTDPVRRAAMEGARDTGEPAASGKVTLVQEIPDQPAQAGFLIYMPVYHARGTLGSVEERRAALAGWVYSPFRTADLLNGILGDAQAGPLQFAVYDGTSQSSAAELYAYRPDTPPSPRNPLQAIHTVDVAGRAWTIRFTGARRFDSSTPFWLAPAALAGGLLLSLGLFALTLLQYRGRVTAERHAAQLTTSEEALRESEARLRRLVVLERESRAEAQAADRAKDEFLATLSHELRTPLNAILGWINMLRSGRVRDERRVGALEVIERNAKAQARLIEDLLDVSRIITGKVRLELHPLHVGPVAQTAIEALRPAAEAKGVQLHASIDPAVGHVMGDAARLQQVAWNLLSNAIKFTPPGGHVYVEIGERDGELQLHVRDTGAGISADFLPHVFERFRQADSSTTRAHSGVGLGLAIVRHLVDLHGGHVAAHSGGPGLGASFDVRLPLVDRVGATRSAAGEPQRAQIAGIRVLVVDDEEDTLDMLEEALTSFGARVVTARSAQEALSTVQTGGADALVSDIGMPDVDGYSLIRLVRALPGEAGRLPAIALTAYARPEDRQRAIDAGYQVHLAKPVNLDALLDALGRLKPASAI